MFVMVAGRQQGKTVAVCRWLLEQPMNRAIVVADEGRRKHLLRILRDMAPVDVYNKYWSERVVVVEYATRGLLRGLALQVAIDDLEYVLVKLFNAEVDFATINATLINPQRNYSPPPQSPPRGYDYEGEVVDPNPIIRDAHDRFGTRRGVVYRDDPREIES